MKLHIEAHRPQYQSISGLARSNDSAYLAVHDIKVGQEGARLSRYEPDSGEMEAVEVDWSVTGPADDLEGITQIDGSDDHYLAVEGSRWGGRTPQLFTMSYRDGKAVAEKKHDLPELPHEVEGVATKKLEDGNLLVLALTMHGERPNSLFFGCDNETYGGTINSGLFSV